MAEFTKESIDYANVNDMLRAIVDQTLARNDEDFGINESEMWKGMRQVYIELGEDIQVLGMIVDWLTYSASQTCPTDLPQRDRWVGLGMQKILGRSETN